MKSPFIVAAALALLLPISTAQARDFDEAPPLLCESVTERLTAQEVSYHVTANPVFIGVEAILYAPGLAPTRILHAEDVHRLTGGETYAATAGDDCAGGLKYTFAWMSGGVKQEITVCQNIGETVQEFENKAERALKHAQKLLPKDPPPNPEAL